MLPLLITLPLTCIARLCCCLCQPAPHSDLIAYKVLSVGDALGGSRVRRAANTTAASAGGPTARAAMLGSGVYTYWAQQDGTGIGETATLAAGVTSIASCCSVCDDTYDCGE